MKVYSQLEKAQLENTTSDTGSLPKGMITYRTDLNIAKVSNGTSMLALIDESTAQTLSNKTYASPIITGAEQFNQITTPATPASGNNKLYFKADGKLYTLDSAGNEAAVGSGSGGVKNLITNGNADDTASSIFVPYADAAGTRPVDGTGGSPTVTTSVSTVSPLDGVKSYLLTKPASNVQGQGWAVPFTVDPAYRAKSLKISADYIVNSGTFVAGGVGVESDVIWYIYDVTNSQLIEPSNIKMFSQNSSIADKFEATFQTSATGSSYKLIAHVQSTSALAFELKVDNVTVSPQVYVYGTPVTASQSYTPTGSWDAATYEGSWWRVGDKFNAKIKVTATGAPTANELQFTLADIVNGLGITVDPTGIMGGMATLGTWAARDLGTAEYDGTVYLYGGSVIYLGRGIGGGQLNKTTPFTVAAGDIFELEINNIPIVGWSSSVKMSDSTDGRLISSQARRTSNQSLPNATFTKVLFDSKDYDYGNNFDLVNSRFIAPSAGLYELSGYINQDVGTGARAVTIYKNGSPLETIANVAGISGSGFSNAIPLSHKFSLLAGEYLEVYAYQDSGGTTNIVANCAVNFTKVDNPAAIAESETVACKYYSSGGVSHTTGVATLIPFDNKVFDTHNAFDTATGKFTAPSAGFYQVHSTLTFNGGTNVGRRGLFILKNGGADSFGTFFGANSTNGLAAHGSDIFYLNAGDFIQVQGFQDSGGTLTTTNDAAGNFLSIARIK